MRIFVGVATFARASLPSDNRWPSGRSACGFETTLPGELDAPLREEAERLADVPAAADVGRAVGLQDA